MKFAAENDITFPLISDEKQQLQQLYELGRVTYIIDPQGVIRYFYEGIPDNKVLLEKLRTLQ